MAKKQKPPFPSGCPVIYDPQYKDMSPEQRKLKGQLMFYLTEIPDPDTGYSSGHCIVIHDEKVLQMIHTVDLRKATDSEF